MTVFLKILVFDFMQELISFDFSSITGMTKG